jgi:signal transduction histidine kinase/ActR/RegA family two-component response regulator
MRRASDAQLTAIRRRRELIAEFTGSDGVPRVYGIAAVRGNGTESVMFVTVGAPRATLLAGIDRQLRLELLAFAALALGILGSAAIVVEWVVRRPVARLIDATAKLAAGHLETRIDRVAGMPELAVLGVAFNDMAGKLEERERQLRQGQRLEAIGQLAGGVAHDFNNLLQVIIGYCEMLQAQVPPGSRSAADVAQVRAAADTAAGLTRQLLAFGRRQLLQPQPVTLNEVVSGMTSLIEHTMGSNIRIVTVFEPTPCVVLADPAQMEQVILNLALNARDAMPEGGEMRLETIATDVPDGYRRSGALVPRGEYVVLRISDTGMGMSDAVRERIFEPFFTTKGAAGNGLGLATVYGIVKQSGGFIFCESALGRGTRFEVFLPRTSEVVPTAAKPVVAGPERGAERILVVDDQDNVRQLLAQLLRQRGYRVLETGRPEEALDWIRAGTALDLLITDVRMPDMSGPQLAEHVLRLRPGVPVMFISGYASDHGDAASAGSRFLQKPFSPDDLLRKVREMLRTDPQPAV